MINMKLKKAARDLSDAAFDYAELIGVTEYRFDNEILIFAQEREKTAKARKKSDDQKFMYNIKVGYNSAGAKKIMELAGDIMPKAAAELSEDKVYFKAKISEEIKAAVRDLSDLTFDYLDVLRVSVRRWADHMYIYVHKCDVRDPLRTLICEKIKYDEADAVLKIKRIIKEIPLLAAEVAARKEYPRLEKGVPREPEKPKKTSFFGRGKAV